MIFVLCIIQVRLRTYLLSCNLVNICYTKLVNADGIRSRKWHYSNQRPAAACNFSSPTFSMFIHPNIVKFAYPKSLKYHAVLSTALDDVTPAIFSGDFVAQLCRATKSQV